MNAARQEKAANQRAKITTWFSFTVHGVQTLVASNSAEDNIRVNSPGHVSVMVFKSILFRLKTSWLSCVRPHPSTMSVLVSGILYTKSEYIKIYAREKIQSKENKITRIFPVFIFSETEEKCHAIINTNNSIIEVNINIPLGQGGCIPANKAIT